MRDQRKYFSVNWIDGMKINKNHFIDTDNAVIDAIQDTTSFMLTPLRYGVLAPSLSGEETFDVTIGYDNQNGLRVSVLSLEAVTVGGVRISVLSGKTGAAQNGITSIIPFATTGNDGRWWLFIAVNPFEKIMTGNPDPSEDPPRFPNVSSSYSIQLVNEKDYIQYAQHPYMLAIGRFMAKSGSVIVDENYIPPCFSINAHPDLIALHSELDKFAGDLEVYCSQIIQKILRKNQQNEIAELIQFLCDRMILYITQMITASRWTRLYETPAAMLADISTLARIMKNAIDLRIGSGKDEMMTYFIEWCELKQGELEAMLSGLANSGYDHNDIDRNIVQIITFVKVTNHLFATLSKLEFIGKKKESGIFLKEQTHQNFSQPEAPKAKRRFFG